MSRNIISTSDTIGGQWRFEGTRIPVSYIGLLAWRGTPYSQILEDYPQLTIEDILTATQWITLTEKVRLLARISPIKVAKFIFINVADKFDHYIVRHTFYPLCRLVSLSSWWEI